MRAFEMKIVNNTSLSPFIAIDGRPVRLKRNAYGNYVYRTETAADAVRVSVTYFSQMRSRHWFVLSLFFFVVGLFGLFDVVDRRCREMSCDFLVRTDGNGPLTLRFLPFADGARAMAYEYDGGVTETENRYSFNAEAKKRLKIMRFVKTAVWLAIVAATIAAVAVFV